MELIRILNHCHRHRGFVYQHARFAADQQSIEVDVRPRVGSAANCSGCHQPAPGYDHLPLRRFEFIPLWGFLVFLLYRMRRVECRNCGVVVEEVPWCDGKHQLTRAYMLFLARWARKLSWKETAPLELPVRAEWFGGHAETVGVVSRKSSYRIRILDEDQSKELEARRKGLSNVMQRLTYPLADGVRWIPRKAQPLLERERTRLEKDAKDLLQSLIAGGASEFAKSRREAIKRDANEMYAKASLGSGKQLPDSTLNLILRDLQNRLAKATQGDFLPKVTYMSAQFSTHADSEHLSQWAQVRTLLLATAKYFRESVTMTGHLKGI